MAYAEGNTGSFRFREEPLGQPLDNEDRVKPWVDHWMRVFQEAGVTTIVNYRQVRNGIEIQLDCGCRALLGDDQVMKVAWDKAGFTGAIRDLKHHVCPGSALPKQLVGELGELPQDLRAPALDASREDVPLLVGRVIGDDQQ